MNGRMSRMSIARKLKVSLTLSADLLALIDRVARDGNDTRSGVVEQWLRRAVSATTEQEIEDATAAYYAGLRAGERKDEDRLAHGLSRASRRVSYDDVRPRRSKR